MPAVRGTLKPLRDKIIVTDMHFGEEKTKTGIVLLSDDGKSSGLHPRWARVLFVGHEQKDIAVGQWILIQHGRWSRGIKYVNENDDETVIHLVDNKGILLVSDEKPEEDAHRIKVGTMNFEV